MRKYEKGNQVYTVQEGSLLEAQLIADGFEAKSQRFWLLIRLWT